MKLSASIVTYNSSDEIQSILEDLSKCLEYGLDTLIVVDNNSTDDTKKIIKSKFGWVKLIESNKNLGYGAGHNLAIKEVDSDFHLIINPDISIDPSNFSNIMDFCRSEDFSVACPKVLNSDGSEQYLPKLNPKFLYILGGILKPFRKYRDEYTMKNRNLSDITEVDFCTGCFTICKTNYLKDCGGYDERYFMYLEDADLTRTLKKYGRALYNPHIVVTHLWKRENHRSLKGIVRWFGSYFKYCRKWKRERRG